MRIGIVLLPQPRWREDAVARAAEAGSTEVVAHRPRARGVCAGDEAALEEVAARPPQLRAL
ncbi:hypothetical protein [Quadrisphaera sp. DSM 44207]|uniref:hypothetical protein n=1 Tax=Quadrisphaera sp. DSM 44207 TaxID=1881057 RepID=UPI000888D92A|nr:hypothetical protein [Quadrisphaera sp. DSM 44207]SDQ65223.1 hypothetical protein SAMN05428996_2246 [Quadrisphaera sp. DSM 44207]